MRIDHTLHFSCFNYGGEIHGLFGYLNHFGCERFSRVGTIHLVVPIQFLEEVAEALNTGNKLMSENLKLEGKLR
jgi:F0F1-type ATP synthase membrane subunit a